MSSMKISLIASSAWAIYITTSAPNHALKDEEMKKTSVAEHIVIRLPIITQAIFWLLAAMEMAVILASVAPSLAHSQSWATDIFVCNLKPDSISSVLRIDITYMLGWSFLLIGAMIRRSCYLTLGPFFTFQLSIREHHKLITSGLYGFVRHSNYTGAIFVLAGSNLCFSGRGSWLEECTTYGHKLAILMWIWAVIAVGSGIARIRKEDDMMRKAFGREWEEWAKAVPWKLFPGIY